MRRWCAPLLALPPFPTPEAYLARRLELGASVANRRLLAVTGAELLLLDTLLQCLQEQGLVKARGRQRTDSTHVLVV